jgi:SnoaL-like polyketide cyclase
MATSAWLRSVFTGLRFDVIEMVSADDRTIAHVWMRGAQTGPFVIFPNGKPVAFAPTRREVAVRQCHIFRLRDGMHAEHISVRDDLGMMTQLGHLPPIQQRSRAWPDGPCPAAPDVPPPLPSPSATPPPAKSPDHRGRTLDPPAGPMLATYPTQRVMAQPSAARRPHRRRSGCVISLTARPATRNSHPNCA